MEDFLQAGALLLHGPAPALGLLFAAVLLHFLSEPLRWRIYTRGPEHPPFSRLFHLFNLASLLSFLLPLKLGAPARLWLIYRLLELPAGRVSAWVLMDGLTYYACWGLLGLLAATRLAAGEVLPPSLRWLFLLLLVAGAGVLLLLRRGGDGGAGPLARLHAEAGLALRQVGPLTLMLATGVILIDVGSQVLRHLAILQLLQVELGLTTLAPVVAVSMAAGLLSPLPMGLGGYDAAVVLLLGILGVPLEQALWVPLVNRAANLAMAAVLGGLGGLRLGINPFHPRHLRRAIGRLRRAQSPDAPP